MARYIDADALIERISKLKVGTDDMYGMGIARGIERAETAIQMQPTADVAPKSEVDRLEYTLLGVMHSVDKWLDGEELEQDEVNRAITMREKTLRIIENAKSEVAKEIVKFLYGRSRALQEVFKNNPDSAQCFRGRFELENAAVIIANDYGVSIENKHGEIVHCKDCEYLMFSDCYGECSQAYKGIVSPDDSCGRGKKKYTEGEK